MTGTDEWLCRRNIAHFRAQHTGAADERQRSVLLALIEEHEAKLLNLSESAKSRASAKK